MTSGDDTKGLGNRNLILIYEKCDRRDSSNYHGITMLSIVTKIYERILEKKWLREWVENQGVAVWV